MDAKANCSVPPASPRRENTYTEQENSPRKKPRRSTIMEALLSEAELTPGQAGSSQMISTVATVPPSSTLPLDTYQHVPCSVIPTSSLTHPIPKPGLSPAGLPFYTHTETLDLPGLPPLPASCVYYFRHGHNTTNAVENVNQAIEQMLGRMNPPPGSRWRGVVGFDMEWTVDEVTKEQEKTGLIQVSDEASILLIQISSMKEFPSKLKDLITSPTIIKVGVNISGDMTKLVKDFGAEYAECAVLELSVLAKAADVGLIGTKLNDLDTNQASVGIGIKRAETQIKAAPCGSASVEQVKGGKTQIQLARLSRRYLGRELEKGKERCSNWDQFLTQKQQEYAANDAHASLALYHALRTVHTRSIAEGTIPVGNPLSLEDERAAATTPIVPPIPAKPATSDDATPNIMSTSELQNLAPMQLESLTSWLVLLYDLISNPGRAALQMKRPRKSRKSATLNDRSKALIAAKQKATVVTRTSSQVTAKPKLVSTFKAAKTPGINLVAATAFEVFDQAPTIGTEAQAQLPDAGTSDVAFAGPIENSIAQGASKSRSLAPARRRTAEKKRNEVTGKPWPPLHRAASMTNSSLSTISPGQSGDSSTLASLPPPSGDATHLPPSFLQYPAPTRTATPPETTSQRAASSEQLHAYLLWHNQLFTVAQICTTMGTAKRPLTRQTIMMHILDYLKLDEALDFDARRLKTLVDSDATGWVREYYREFLERKLGGIDEDSQ
ncbi:hypothetical protein BDV93DRAFT_605703 [Ceratobasidium sp. AG-I]|nr:hypothetical protein BDV93DRAFT_605703 [Ceratobasidium sp. AG-I]